MIIRTHCNSLFDNKNCQTCRQEEILSAFLIKLNTFPFYANIVLAKVLECMLIDHTYNLKRMFYMKFLQKNKVNVAMIIGLLFAICLSSFSVFAKECASVRESVLRLHIIPNSNSIKDQTVKLKVRDEILALDETMFDNVTNLEQAVSTSAANIDLIKAAAGQVLAENGYYYPVSVEVEETFFDTREYDTFTLPAGRYEAVVITLGNGNGKNWWCVLYPPLCLPAAMPQEEMKKAMTDEQIALVDGKQKYEIKFATVEIFQKIKEYLTKDKN